MKHFEVTPDGDNSKVSVTAQTRAGLVVAGVLGVLSAAGALAPDVVEAKEVQRPFSIKADDFVAIYGDLMAKAAEQAGMMNEKYDDVHFTLITDKKAEGTLVGRAGATFTRKPSGIGRKGLKVEKDESGQWQTSFTVEF